MKIKMVNKFFFVVLVVLFAVKDLLVEDGSGFYGFLSAVVIAAFFAVMDWSDGEEASPLTPLLARRGERSEGIEEEKNRISISSDMEILFFHQKACTHPGCLAHISHPCEGCGRITGKGNVYVSKVSYASEFGPKYIIGFHAFGFIKYLKARRDEGRYICERVGVRTSVPYTKELLEDFRHLMDDAFYEWLMDDADVPFYEWEAKRRIKQ